MRRHSINSGTVYEVRATQVVPMDKISLEVAGHQDAEIHGGEKPGFNREYPVINGVIRNGAFAVFDRRSARVLTVSRAKSKYLKSPTDVLVQIVVPRRHRPEPPAPEQHAPAIREAARAIIEDIAKIAAESAEPTREIQQYGAASVFSDLPNPATVAEVAQLFRVHRSTIYRAIKRGELSARGTSGSYRISHEDLERSKLWRNDGTTKAPTSSVMPTASSTGTTVRESEALGRGMSRKPNNFGSNSRARAVAAIRALKGKKYD